MGYCENLKSFRMWNPATRKIIISRDVIFKEEAVNKEVSSGETADYESLFPLEEDPENPTAEIVHDRGDMEIVGVEKNHENQIELNEVEEIPAVEAANNEEEAPALDIADNQEENRALDLVDNQEEARTLGTVDNQEEDPFFGWEETRRRSARIHKRMEKVGLRSVE